MARQPQTETPPTRPRRGPLRTVVPWLATAAALVLGGFWWGWQVRDSRRLSAEELRRQESEQLATLGWKPAVEGVLSRWCREDCHPPRLYGGGKAQILEVFCRDRPCGTIRASFRVLDGQGKEIGTTTATREGLRGERLMLVVVSADPRAQRFELDQFSAQAIVY